MLPLLRIKTTIPPIRLKQIRRGRLLERIAQGMQGALTLIVAPAGFGKTSLAAAWAHAGQLPTAWLSLQPADRPRERFLAYLIQALQSIAPYLGQTSLAFMHGGSMEGAIFALANDLAGIENEFALVLDDYHSADNPETAAVLQFLLENRPVTFHLIITSRTAPNLNLARLRALGQVTEINAADLRFTQEEARAFLETSMDLRLPDEALAHLNQSTEGWAVGLQLAALALTQQPGQPQSQAGQEYIFDYLAEEVLRREPAEVQQFLKVSAIFDRFCAPLCEEVSVWRSGGADALIAGIARANLFLVPLDSDGVWYRYHALFTDFLRRQLSTEQARPLYLAASGWCEENGLLDEAIHYAVHATDYTRAAGLLESHYIDMVKRGEQTALVEWIGMLPPELLDQYPRLWLALGWASIISLDSIRAAECARKAEALISPGTAGKRLRDESKSLRILSNIFAGNAAAVDDIDELTDIPTDQDEFLHSLLHFNLGLHHVMQGQTARAVEAFSETLRLTASLNNPIVTIVAQVQMGETRQLRGALGLAERTFQQAIRYARETLGEQTFLLGMPYISYAELLREQNRFDEARRYAEQGIAFCQVWQPVASMDGQITLARLLAAQNHWDEAFDRLEHAMQVAENSTSILDDTFVAIHIARLALIRGDGLRAAQVIQAYELEKTSQATYYHLWEMAQMALLRNKIAGLDASPEQGAQVCAELSELIARAERRERIMPVIEALLLRARALHATGQGTSAQELSRAVTLGAQCGCVRILADEGLPLLRLLNLYRPQIHAPRTYLEGILAILRRENATPDDLLVEPARASFPLQEGLTPLTRRELDILQLLAAGKSNQEIAIERVLTLNTVKKHVANILSKLGVANRTQAGMLARKLGWIE